MLSEARSALQRYFGYPDFRPGQRDAILAVLQQSDALVVMPTGGGKSLCYQIPALLREGVTLVISPLIALMLDQVDALTRRGIAAAFVNSTLAADEIEERLRRAAAGQLKLLYVAPERFESARFRRALQGLEVELVAVDEAHCVCEWGHDFRPSYLRLRQVWPVIGRPQLVALTATATPEVRRDIVKDLGLECPRVIIRGFDRPNLRWAVRRLERIEEKSQTLTALMNGGDDSALVYASTRKMVVAATEFLRSRGVSAGAYHAGLPREQRARVQEEWMSGRLPVVVATNAFGMGIDKDDVRRVVHFQMPGSLEAYYQEAGRAGRDGEASECVLLHSYRDRFVHELFIRASYPPKKVILAAYEALADATAQAGGPVGLSRFGPRVPGVKSERELYSALRILTDAGAVRAADSRRCASLRWIASRRQLRDLLGDGGSAQGLPRLALLESLARRSNFGARRWFRVPLQELARLFGGDHAALRSALAALQAEGVLGWREEGKGSGYALGDARRPARDLPIDWERIGTRRALELRKLRRMERYAFQGGCRRRYLLSYFGDECVGLRCGSCDRCRPLEPTRAAYFY